MKTIKKYKHFLPVVVYGIFFLKCFQYLETHITKGYHLIHTPFDDMVPFCEFFVIPYFMWFGFIAWSVLYFGLCNSYGYGIIYVNTWEYVGRCVCQIKASDQIRENVLPWEYRSRSCCRRTQRAAQKPPGIPKRLPGPDGADCVFDYVFKTALRIGCVLCACYECGNLYAAVPAGKGGECTADTGEKSEI